MASELANRLRQQIEAKHAKALQALKELEEYLTDHDMEKNGPIPPLFSQESPTTPISNRDRVIAIIRDGWATAAQIRVATGFDDKRVRGVLNAKHLVAKIQRRTNASGQMEFHWQGD